MNEHATLDIIDDVTVKAQYFDLIVSGKIKRIETFVDANYGKVWSIDYIYNEQPVTWASFASLESMLKELVERL